MSNQSFVKAPATSEHLMGTSEYLIPNETPGHCPGPSLSNHFTRKPWIELPPKWRSMQRSPRDSTMMRVDDAGLRIFHAFQRKTSKRVTRPLQSKSDGRIHLKLMTL